MDRNYLIILGNGFTIDFLKQFNEQEVKDIDVKNLFSQGDVLNYPQDNSSGYLNRKHCRHLWDLGIRPYMSNQSAADAIENIVTATQLAFNNLSLISKIATLDKEFDNAKYIYAYQELVYYLRYLFIEYNQKITDQQITRIIHKWEWTKFFKKVDNSDQFKKVTIVTYNYDIWLERVLIKLGINFRVIGVAGGYHKSNIHKNKCKFNIIKPHGSISFLYKNLINEEFMKWPPSMGLENLVMGKIGEYHVSYKSNKMIKRYIVSPIIPPDGNAVEMSKNATKPNNWSEYLRSESLKAAQSLTKDSEDEVIICGFSYRYVDQSEINQILMSIDNQLDIRMINPNLPGNFDAVLTTLFTNYSYYTKSSFLRNINFLLN